MSSTEQPMPSQGDGTILHDRVMAYLRAAGLLSPEMEQHFQARYEKGLETYHTPLQPWNGRSFLHDLRDELGDALMYTEGEIKERDDMANALVAVTAALIDLERALGFVFECDDLAEIRLRVETYHRVDYASERKRIAEFFHRQFLAWMGEVRNELSKAHRETLRDYNKPWQKLDYALRLGFLQSAEQLMHGVLPSLLGDDDQGLI